MNRLDSTELVTNNQSRPHVRLPQSVMGHCLININQTHYLLAGGLAGTGYDSKSKLSTAYLYSEITKHHHSPSITHLRIQSANQRRIIVW